MRLGPVLVALTYTCGRCGWHTTGHAAWTPGRPPLVPPPDRALLDALIRQHLGPWRVTAHA